MFYDANDVQLSTKVDEVTSEDTAAKYRAWNWNVIEIDGSNPDAICGALETAIQEEKRPTIIIGHTIMAKDCIAADGSSCEGWVSTHGQPLSKAGVDVDSTISRLGGDPENPWKIWDDVATLFNQRKETLREKATLRHEQEKKWREENPELAQRLDNYIAGRLPDIDWDNITAKPGSATRASSAAVLNVLAKELHNMIVSSADLANSDKTDAFLKNTKAIEPDDFSGAFLHAGVAELTMASIINGIALHGGLIGACATFFVFSDYMKPAIRMSALMQLPVKYIFTHDTFRVGEDGPTHQPVEQEAQIRLLEQMTNFSGHPAALVLRPADTAETVECWKMALENRTSPSILILSRQDIPDLPGQTRASDAVGTEKGAYVVVDSPEPQIILAANGSEVSLLCEAASRLAEEGIRARVVSAPSIGLFNNQSLEYRESIIPNGVKLFGLTAGLPATLLPLMRGDWEIYGLDHFGVSAPYTVLDREFGFTTDNIVAQIKQFLLK